MAHPGIIEVVTTEVERLLIRLRPLFESSSGCVVLERIARGAGSTQWLFCRSLADVETILPRLRPGSWVGFFFDDRIRQGSFGPEVEQEIWDIATSTGEVLVGVELSDGLEIDMHYSDPEDLSEYTASLWVGQTVYYGEFPFIEDDGVRSISFTPPDADGVVRPQPI